MRFLLVHGAFHGAWCWDKVIPELEALGHCTLAIDLPGHGQRVGEKATFRSYQEAIVEVIEDGDIVVGHADVGGWSIAAAADKVPEKVGRLVWIAAASPVEGKYIMEANPYALTPNVGLAKFVHRVESDVNGACLEFEEEGLRALMFSDLTEEDKKWACERVCLEPLEPVTTPVSLSAFWEAPIPKSYIMATDDPINTLEFTNLALRRLGLSSCIGILAGHDPFISQPMETAHALESCALGKP